MLATIKATRLQCQQYSNLPTLLAEQTVPKIRYTKYLNHLGYNIPVIAQFTAFFELRFWKAVRILEQSMYIFTQNKGYCL